jgi:endoglucanase
VLFEPYNEPLDVAWSAVIKPYHEEIVTEIRKHSQNIIVLGTRNWCQEVDEAASDPVDGENLAYCLHFYASTHKGSYRNKAQGALDKGKAVFASEWGTCEADGNGALDLSSVATWHDWMDQNSISSANWAVSDKDESCSALIPGASAQGSWGGEEQLTQSGVWVRNRILTGINGAGGGSGGGGGDASGGGCCKFEGSSTCGDCGDDGTGWCHGSANNCNTCTGTFDDSAQKPACAR